MYGVDDIRLEEIPVPVPQTGEILLKVKAAAVCGTDVRMIKNGAAGIDEQHPRILGHEIAGIIEETGDGVTGYEKGMRVSVAPNMGCGICDMCVSGNSHLCPDYKALGINLDGGFAEYCIIPAQAVKSGNVCILEDGVTFDDGAVNEPLSCVCNGFERADIRPGDRVLVIGAGPIGIMHCALALMAGAVVYLNDVCAERLEEAKRIYPAINIIKGDPEKELPEGSRCCYNRLPCSVGTVGSVKNRRSRGQSYILRRRSCRKRAGGNRHKPCSLQAAYPFRNHTRKPYTVPPHTQIYFRRRA